MVCCQSRVLRDLSLSAQIQTRIEKNKKNLQIGMMAMPKHEEGWTILHKVARMCCPEPCKSSTIRAAKPHVACSYIPLTWPSQKEETSFSPTTRGVGRSNLLALEVVMCWLWSPPRAGTFSQFRAACGPNGPQQASCRRAEKCKVRKLRHVVDDGTTHGRHEAGSPDFTRSGAAGFQCPRLLNAAAEPVSD